MRDEPPGKLDANRIVAGRAHARCFGMAMLGRRGSVNPTSPSRVRLENGLEEPPTTPTCLGGDRVIHVKWRMLRRQGGDVAHLRRNLAAGLDQITTNTPRALARPWAEPARAGGRSGWEGRP